jgi:hypothetical protein
MLVMFIFSLGTELFAKIVSKLKPLLSLPHSEIGKSLSKGSSEIFSLFLEFYVLFVLSCDYLTEGEGTCSYKSPKRLTSVQNNDNAHSAFRSVKFLSA